MFASKTKLAALLLSGALLAACGGGGGGSSSTPVASTESFPLQTVWANYFNDTRSLNFTLSGSISGVGFSGSGTLTQNAPASTSFEGASALEKVTDAEGSLVLSGVSTPWSASSTLYVDSAYTPLGSDTDGRYAVVSGAVTIPASAKVGDSGTWFSANLYDSSSKNVQLGTSTTTYVLEADTATTAIARMIETDRDLSNNVTGTTTSTFRITTAGAITPLWEQYQEGGDTIKLTYQ